MNFVFVSPNFPASYWLFCARLKANGVNVLGIGDSPYEQLTQNLRDSLTEYYRVGSLENYDEMVRALGYFTFKYGKIDGLESNNEYWLEKDAALRTDFNIPGLKTADMAPYKRKSAMKAFFEKAGIPCARYHMVSTLEAARGFVREVGYPVVVKPDNGVGANNTWKLRNDDEMAFFFDHLPETPYIMEEYIDGIVTTFDGVCDSRGNILFAASHITADCIMDIVNESRSLYYYVDRDIPQDVRDAGTRCIQSFGVRSRCFHIEFFRLRTGKPGLGNPGDIVALEVNMRPAGGFTPDMINYASSVDMYKIWADMVAFDRTSVNMDTPHQYCCYVSRRDKDRYRYSNEDVLRVYGDRIKISGRMADALSGAMGNSMFVGCFQQQQEMEDFVRFIQELA